MEEKKWIGFTDNLEVDIKPQIKISKTSQKIATKDLRDDGERTSLKVHYTTQGAWEGTVKEFQLVEVPNTSTIDQEGAPSIPKDGIFVAVPSNAEDIQIKVINKSFKHLDHQLNLLPVPKQFIEEEFKEVYEPDPSIYSLDDQFPGKDFDYLGLKQISGINVVHLLVYLGQYRPKSRSLDLVESMILEISYKSPVSQDTAIKPKNIPDTDLILGLDLLIGGNNDPTPKYELKNSGNDFLHDADIELDTSLFNNMGISFEEQTEDDFTGGEPVAILPRPTTAVAVEVELPAVLRHPVLKVSGIICEYAIITSHSLKDAVQPLLAAKSDWPHYARTVLIEDIQLEFPSASCKESIKAFISWATDHWTVPPRFVVLAGDTDVIPIHIYNLNGRTYASDHYYSDISGDDVQELVVSRIPTSKAAELKSVCENIVKYCTYRGGDWGGWQNKVVLAAYEDNVYETTCDNICNNIKSRFKVIKRYAKNTSKNDLINTLNDGVLIAMYRGHGSETNWSSSNGINTADISNLSNGSMQFFVFNICCQNGWVDDNSRETVAEAFIRKNKAIAAFAASRNSWTYPNNDFAKYLFDAILIGKCNTPAKIISYAKTKMIRNHGSSEPHRENALMYNLFGDPTADVASNPEWLRGDWSMDHDGWKGKLKITRIWNYRNETDNGHSAPVWDISGQYIGADNSTHNFTGKLGGFDSNQLGTSKRSDHKIELTIDFSNTNKQKFVGYVHTWTLNKISGLTWWSTHPFGWTTVKI
jgi:hypothetical protein